MKIVSHKPLNKFKIFLNLFRFTERNDAAFKITRDAVNFKEEKGETIANAKREPDSNFQEMQRKAWRGNFFAGPHALFDPRLFD